MKFKTVGFLLICQLLVLPVFADDDHKLAIDKVRGDLSVLVLGSGGPMATASGRASAGYLIFVDGQPRILMDAGGGTYQRLAESGVNVKDLDLVLLSHLHIDHTGDLSSIIKTVYFHSRGANLANGTFPPGRTAPIHVWGPGANGVKFPPVLQADPTVAQYPATSEYLHAHYDLNMGVERYLNVFARAISGGIFKYEPHDVPAGWTSDTTSTLYDQDGLVIKAIGVNHGPVPANAFRIEYKGKSIVYSGDTSSQGTLPNGTALANGGNMVTISRDADLLIYDTAIMDDQPSGPNDAVFFSLHTTPSRIGEVAAAANVGTVLLSHITPITEPNLRQVKSLIRAKGYEGRIKEAEDLDVINLR